MPAQTNIYSFSNIITTFVFVLALTYFCFHAISGDRGLFALIKLSKQIEESKSELNLLTSQRIKIEHKVKLLSSNSLDIDLLDEQARRFLGYSLPDEIIFLE